MKAARFFFCEWIVFDQEQESLFKISDEKGSAENVKLDFINDQSRYILHQ